MGGKFVIWHMHGVIKVANKSTVFQTPLDTSLLREFVGCSTDRRHTQTKLLVLVIFVMTFLQSTG
jgi:hypothetical protein